MLMPMSENQSLLRAVEILDCFQAGQPELGVRAIARQIGLPASTAGRLLATLCSAGVLRQNPETHRYRMGSRVSLWSTAFFSQLDLRTESRPHLEELHAAARETVILCLLEGTRHICVERIEGPQPGRRATRLGEHMPLHAGASGKVLLAFMTPEDRAAALAARPLEKLGTHTITDRDALLHELETVRRQGFAVSHGERLEGASGVAAPIFDARGKVTAAVSISTATERLTPEKISQSTPLVVRAAARISQALGCFTPFPNSLSME
jgi:DNA-binding IclR family transcriptional regulator